MPHLYTSLCLLVLFVSSTLAAQEPPFPIPVPEKWQEFFGDPERGPERSARYENSHRLQSPPVTWPLNDGNPYTDWGHFRLRREIAGHGRMGEGLSHPIFTRAGGDEPVADLLERFDVQDWKDGKLLRYSIMVPNPEETPMPEGGYPLVISCPGSGGVGRQNMGGGNRPHGATVWASRYYRQHMPAVVLVLHPQSRSISYTGDNTKGEFDIGLNPAFDAYLEVIDHYAAMNGINPKRVSVYGHSMGGSSVWALVRARPQLFSAAVPLAGSPFGRAEDYPLLNDTPMWIMMGNDDPWNGSHSYISAYAMMRQAGHQQLRFWEIQDIGHSAGALNLYHVHQWMWSQLRP